MDVKIRQAQENILRISSKISSDFALAGGTALELYYLKHRFSSDLDFFSPEYNFAEIDRLVLRFNNASIGKLKLDSEFIASNKAKVRFYSMPVKHSRRKLKIDFVEDVVLKKPRIVRFSGVAVYDAKDIYLHKLVAICGAVLEEDAVGKDIVTGRQEARDAFDVYMLSRKIQPLHIFLKNVSRLLQRGMVCWYQTFSRHELKLGLLDLDIYDPKFDSKEMIVYLESEIEKFAKETLK